MFEQPLSISIEKTATLQPALRHQIDAMTKEQFGGDELVRSLAWSEPNWTVVVKEGSSLASFLHIVERVTLFDGKKTSVAGINNVITPPEHRGKGYATDALGEAQYVMFNKLKVEFGLLLCADDLVPYYEKLGWYAVDCPLTFSQPDGKKHTWQAAAMLLAPNGSQPKPKKIDLQGTPW
jgi:predicted acetyltransferase